MSPAITNTSRVQHKATLSVGGRNVDIHAPPFVPEPQLDAWLAETLRNPGVHLVSKTWADTERSAGLVERSYGYDPEPTPTRKQVKAAVEEHQNKRWMR